MTDLEVKLEGFETLATECDLIGKLATDRAKRELYQRLLHLNDPTGSKKK